MSTESSSKCRTCLSDSNFFHQLLDYVDANYKILDMLDRIVPQIDIKCKSQFSTLICQTCVDKLLTAYKFQQLCIEANNRIHGMLDIASFETEPKLEEVLDPLTGDTNANMKEEVEDDVFYEQEITPDVLEMFIRSDNDGDWETPASSFSDSKEMLTFQCHDCLKCFEKKASLSAHYKVHREEHDNKLLFKDQKVDTSTKIDKTETPDAENNTEENEPRVCVKEEYKVTPQIFKEAIDGSETNGELFNNNSEDSDDESDTDLFVKPLKPSEDVDFTNTAIAKLKNNNSKIRNYPCEACGRVFNRLFNLKRHDNKLHKEKHDIKLVYKDKVVDTRTEVDKIETPETENNTKENEPRVCVKPKYEISPQIFNKTMDESKTNGELSNNKSDDPDDESDKTFFVKPVKSIKDVNFKNTDIVKIKKPKSSNSKRLNCPCEVCGKVFYSLFNLKRHSSIHSANVANIDIIDTAIVKIKKPNSSNSKRRNYPCKVCGRLFHSLFNLKRHSSIHENITLNQRKTCSRPYSFKCPDCPRRFEEQSYLSNHRRVHYSDYLCIVCQRYFTTLRGLTLHINDKHPEFERYKCDQCEKTFVLHDLLVKHLNRHKDNKNLICLVCKKEFGSSNGLRMHMRTHSGYGNTLTDRTCTPSSESLHLCPQCGKTFTKEAHLRQHLPRHSELKIYLCPECPKRFHCRQNLIKHALTHTNAKPHVCDICGTRFTRASSLRNHKLKHSGERPFKCDQCSMTFAIAEVLKRHMRTHTGEKPYKCKYCERAYAQSGDLTKHLRTHVGENTYMCDQCPMAFKYLAELRQHQAEHYKMAQKLSQQEQQTPNEAQQQEIIDNESIQNSSNDTQHQ